VVPHARVIEPELAGNLSDENRHRLERVLRLKSGDSFIITDGMGHEATAVLLGRGAYRAELWEKPNREPLLELTLCAAVSKGDRFEWLIEKAVEMGVRTIIPLECERGLVKNLSNHKLERWQRIADTAMLQCGGTKLTRIAQPTTAFSLNLEGAEALPILLHEELLGTSLKSLPKRVAGEIWLASGPEGGFSEKEVEHLLGTGWQAVWLGKRLFKTDTAPLVALSVLLSEQWF
jgi:16S rRNA (uracil1498-N3)-methyltransferase